jgi:phosphatidylglycerophosphate synthase
MRQYTYGDVINTSEAGSSWWEELIIRPFVYKLTWLFANYTRFTPNQITVMAFMIGLLSAYFFLYGTQYYLIIGACLFEFSFILDCIDGRIARLKELKSKFGAYLDTMSDFIKHFLVILGLVYGQYLITKDISFLAYGYIFIFSEGTFLASSFVIRLTQPEFSMGKEDFHQMRTMIMKDRLSFFVKLKKIIDPGNKLSFIPLSSIEAETIVLFIAPIVMNIKLGIIIGSIILLINLISAVIFNFSSKKEVK